MDVGFLIHFMQNISQFFLCLKRRGKSALVYERILRAISLSFVCHAIHSASSNSNLPIPAFLFIIFCDRPDDPARIADSNRITWNILDHDAAAAYHNIVSNRNSGHYMNTRTYPYIIAYGNRIAYSDP